MSAILWVVLITSAAGILGTGLGGMTAAAFEKSPDNIVSLLLSFAGGIMLGVVCFDLIPSAIAPDGAVVPMDIFTVMAGIFVGFVSIYFLNCLLERGGRRQAKQSGRYGSPVRRAARYELFVAGIVMACAIALHNFPEGLVIGASYAAEMRAYISSGGAVVMATVIGLHDIPEGMAIAVPLISGGMRRSKAVFITALSGLPTVLGALLGYSLGMMSPALLSFSMCFASGAMLYVVFGELFPESALLYRSKLPAFAAVAGTLLGLLLIYS